MDEWTGSRGSLGLARARRAMAFRTARRRAKRMSEDKHLIINRDLLAQNKTHESRSRQLAASPTDPQARGPAYLVTAKLFLRG